MDRKLATALFNKPLTSKGIRVDPEHQVEAILEWTPTRGLQGLRVILDRIHGNDDADYDRIADRMLKKLKHANFIEYRDGNWHWTWHVYAAS